MLKCLLGDRDHEWWPNVDLPLCVWGGTETIWNTICVTFFLIFKNVLLTCRCDMYVQEHTSHGMNVASRGELYGVGLFLSLLQGCRVGLFGCLTFRANALLTEPCQSLVVISATGSHHSSSRGLRACLLWKRSTNCQKQTVKGKNSSWNNAKGREVGYWLALCFG